MAVALYALFGLVASMTQPASGLAAQLAALLLLVGGGGIFYFVLTQLTGAADLRALARQVARRPQ